MLKKLAAISLTAGALVLVAPTIATAAPTIPDASSDSYPSPPGVKVGDPIIDVCEVSTIVFGPGYFLPSENVAVSVSGKNAGKAATSGNTAGADGSMTLTFRPPADGEGSYAVAFGGSRPYTATITVSHGHDAASSCDHDPAVAPRGYRAAPDRRRHGARAHRRLGLAVGARRWSCRPGRRWGARRHRDRSPQARLSLAAASRGGRLDDGDPSPSDHRRLANPVLHRTPTGDDPRERRPWAAPCPRGAGPLRQGLGVGVDVGGCSACWIIWWMYP